MLIVLARMMTKGMGMKLKIETLSLDEMLPALEKGDVGLVIYNMTVNPQRKLKVAFVDRT